ncbi:CBS domain-containing protein [Bacillus spongiae]|uniref:CBS domain-containing protein n=1 Tax=Bacillus spongiae TaxID=2683610 RepID=A0ABU8HA55_9BACI
MNVDQIMTKDVECCTVLDNVYEAAALMKEHNVGSIPVLDGKKLVGMITDRDIVIRGVAEKHPGSAKIDTVMSSNVYSVSADTTVEDALNIMQEHQIRRLPIVDNEALIGIVSLGDFSIKSNSHQVDETLHEISEQNH